MPPYPWEQQQQQQPQQQAPEWNREAFRDQWMSSGMRNVNDMNSWLQNTGWGQHVKTGGSKGDKMYLPNGDVIDAVYAAGLGGNLAPPTWTGAGNWKTGQSQEEYLGGKSEGQGLGPSQGMMQQQLDPRMQQMQMHKQFQNRRQSRPGMMQYQNRMQPAQPQRGIGMSQRTY